MFIFLLDLGEEARDKVVDGIREEISKLDGNVLRTESLGRRTFARPLKKQEEGYYVRLHVELGPEAIDALLARFKLNPDIFRLQILRAPAGSELPPEKDDIVEPGARPVDEEPAEVGSDG
jgi:ribosomal protein S6